MSFSYKTLNSNDITLTSYIANKQWEVKNSNLSQNGVSIFVGENLPINRENIFDPLNDINTYNQEYRRLIFESIKHLYYENYTSGSLTNSFFQSSSYFNYEQTTLISGSMLSSYKSLPTQEGGKIVVISIDKEIFGSGLTPNSVFISGSDYYLRDDGEGNLYNFYNEDNYARYNEAIYDESIYLEITPSIFPQLEYVGNVFYSHGLIVITDSNYLCIFGSPPTAVNNHFEYLNINPLLNLDILSNDFSDCGDIITNSFSSTGGNFPDYTYSGGFINITPNQSSVIPGDYNIGYTILNSSGVISNTGSINLNITSKPLEINNLIYSSSAYGIPTITPITFSIDYGVPYYSYSLDNSSSYIDVNTLFNITVNNNITSSNYNIIYIKDYLGNIASQSFSTWREALTYTYSLQFPPCGETGTSGELYVYSNTATSASLNGGDYKILPYLFQNASTSSTVSLKNDFNDITSSLISLDPIPPITSSLLIQSASGYGASNGGFSLSLDNIFPSLNPIYTIQTGSYILPEFNGINITSSSYNFNTSSLPAGIYTASATLSSSYSCGLQQYLNYINIPQPSIIEFTVTGSYIESGSNSIILNATGGIPPYTYFAKNITTNTIHSSDNPTIPLNTLNSGSYTLFIIDNNSFTSPTQSIEIYGRTYIYSGSTCEQI